MTEAGTDTMASTAQPIWHALGTDEALQAQGVDAPEGLSSAEIAAPSQTYGPNKFAEQARESRWHAHGDTAARIMGVAAFSLFHLRTGETPVTVAGAPAAGAAAA
jgi:hypothetical protein